MAFPTATSRRSLLFLALLLIPFFFFGLAIIPHVGIQTDEAFFSGALFDDAQPWFSVSLFQKKVPLMVMTYLGTAKAALYSVLFEFVPPCAYSLRVPMLVLGALTIILFYFLLARSTNSKVAWFGAALLASDASFLLTTVFDWGPVAIQHFCLTAALFLLLRFHQAGSAWRLAAGFFLLGLGMWDKALFAWLLSALVVASAAAFHTELRRHWTTRKITAAGFFFLLGALPLVIYNVQRPLETFRDNASLSADELRPKLGLMRVALNGSVFFGFLVEEDWLVKPRPPSNGVERAVLAVRDRLGDRRENFYWPAFIATLALCPFLLLSHFRRPVMFSLIFLLVAWAQMLATKGAGGGVHHTILLWPLPLFLTAIAAAWVAERLGTLGTPFLILSALVLCGSSLAVLNQYLAQAIRNGAPGNWSAAHYSLSKALPKHHATRIYITDWGMFDNTRMLHKGRLPLHVGSGPIMTPAPFAGQRAELREMLAHPGAIFVSNTDDRQVFPNVNQNLRQLSRELGFDRELLETIYDPNGRPCYEIFQFRVIGP